MDGKLFKCQDFFAEHGWVVLCPYSKDTKLKNGLVQFYKDNCISTFAASDIEDVYVVARSKPNGEHGYAGVFTFGVWEVCRIIVCYIVYAFVSEE